MLKIIAFQLQLLSLDVLISMMIKITLENTDVLIFIWTNCSPSLRPKRNHFHSQWMSSFNSNCCWFFCHFLTHVIVILDYCLPFDAMLDIFKWIHHYSWAPFQFVRFFFSYFKRKGRIRYFHKLKLLWYRCVRYFIVICERTEHWDNDGCYHPLLSDFPAIGTTTIDIEDDEDDVVDFFFAVICSFYHLIRI